MSKCPVCGKDDMNMFRDDACLTCRIGAYLDGLKAAGMRARILPDGDPEAPRHSLFRKLGSVREACIKLQGSVIEFIELWRTDSRFVTWFTITYMMAARNGYDKKDLVASLGEPTSAFHERMPLTKYEWKGGSLARALSSDKALREGLIPNEGQIEVRYDPRNRIVAITEVVGDHYPDPEPKHIEAMETIIRHIQELPSREE